MSKPCPQSHPNAIRQYRHKRGLKIEEVSRAMGFANPSSVALWERGIGYPSLTNALKLQIILQCPIEILFLDLRDSLKEGIHQHLNPPDNEQL